MRTGTTAFGGLVAGRSWAIRSRSRAFPLFGAMEALEARQLLAAVTWTGGAGNFLWHSPANWSNNQVPTSVDDVMIPDLTGTPTILFQQASGNRTIRTLISAEAISVTGGILSIAESASCDGLFSLVGGRMNFNGTTTLASLAVLRGGPPNQQTSGTLAGSGAVTVTGSLGWTSGLLTGTGRLIVAAGAVGSISNNNETVLARPLDNSGTLTASGSSNLRFDPGSAINNLSGGTLTILSGDFSFNDSLVHPVTNDGTLTKSGSGITDFRNISLVNTGTLHVAGGTLMLDGGGSNTGTITIDSGKTLLISNSFSFGAGDVTGNGTLSLAGGTVTIDTPLSLYDVGMSSTVLTGSGDVTIRHSLFWASGTMSGTGHTILPAGATVTLSVGGEALSLGRTFDNSGSVTMIGAYRLHFITGGIFNNLADGNFTIQNGGFASDGGVGEAFNNAGTFTVVSGSLLQAPFNNSGVVNLPGGFVYFLGGGSNTGTIVLTGAPTLVFDAPLSFQFTAGTISGLGSYNFRSGSVSFEIPVSLATVTFSGGAAAFNAPATLGTVDFQTGELTGSGDVTIASSLTWVNGIMDGSGRTIIAAGATGRIGSPPPVQPVLARRLESASTNLTCNNFWQFRSGAVFNNLQGARFVFSGRITSDGNAGNLIENAGTLSGGGEGYVQTIQVLVHNTGTLNVTGGLRFDTGSEQTFFNDGTVRCSVVGVLTVNGNFVQTDSARFESEVTTNPFVGVLIGRIVATGTATLAGAFSVTLYDPFNPQVGDSFAFVTAASVSGRFATVSLPAVATDRKLAMIYADTSVQVLFTLITDFNNDGVANADDLADFITGYFNTPVDPATDFNGDGVVNADDLADFITAFFA